MMFLRRSTVSLVLFAAVPTLGACSSKGDDGEPSADVFCEARANRECIVAEACTVTQDACTTARRATCAQQMATAALDQRFYSPTRGSDCLMAIARAFGAAPVPGWELDARAEGSMAEVCNRVFEGRGKEGDACSTDAQCAPGFACANGQGKRICATRTVHLDGEACGNPGDTCAEGLFCNGATGVPRCAARPAAGEECSADKPCLESLRCDTVCRPKLGVGEKCGSSDDCGAAAPYCDPYAGFVCGPGLILTGASPVCREFGKTTP
jgi:hypothetical protein